MQGGNSGNTTFSNLRDIGTSEAKRAEDALTVLRRKLDRAGAEGAAGRLAGIDRDIGNGRLADLEQRADPDWIVDELIARRGGLRHFYKSPRVAGAIRNITALAPLIFTWWVLGSAAKLYQGEVNAPAPPHGVNPLTQPFLLLWQQGFGTGSLTFQRVTVIDFALLLVVLLATIWVHWAEGLEEAAAQSVYAAMGSLRAALASADKVVTTPTTPQEWAATTSRQLDNMVQSTQALNAASELAIKQAAEQLKSVQDEGKRFITEFRQGVLEALVGVQQQNQHFIEEARQANREVLQAVVEQQMGALLADLRAMLGQFRDQQAQYATAVGGLTQGVDAIQGSAAELAGSARSLSGSAQQFTGSTQSIAGSLQSMALAQDKLAAQAGNSAAAMDKAAAAMTGVKQSFEQDLAGRVAAMTASISASASKSLADVAASVGAASQGVAGMAANVEAASQALRATEESLAATTEGFRAAGGELRAAARDLKEGIPVMRSPMGQIEPLPRRWWHRMLFLRRGSL